MSPGPDRRAGPTRSRGLLAPPPWVVTTGFFLLAAAAIAWRLGRPITEGDEWIYRALVEQLDAGRGYTLQGHPILMDEDFIPEQYDRPLFHHPPAGIVLYWLAYHFLGHSALRLPQLLSFALWYWSLVRLARTVLPTWDTLGALVTGGLAAFDPIVTHIHLHLWLDGPQLAFATAGGACLALALVRGRLLWSIPAGLLLGIACLIKLNALVILPGLAALALALACERTAPVGDAKVPRGDEPEPERGPPARRADRLEPARVKAWSRAIPPVLLVLALAILSIVPWFVWRYRVYGTLAPGWAGRPAEQLVAINPFVHEVTIERSAWSYLWLLPTTLWTLVPALLLLVALRDRSSLRLRGRALVLWIGVIVCVQIVLGYLGYSKLLRYVALIVPAEILLFALGVTELRRTLRGRTLSRTTRWGLTSLALVAALGFALEIVHGAEQPLVYPWTALIPPITGLSE